MTRTKRGLLFFVPAMLLSLSPAWGAIFRVDSAVDAADADLMDGVCDDGTGFCTLRAAIEQANAGENMDYVILAEATYFLANGALRITNPLQIIGEGEDKTIIDGNRASSVLEFDPLNPVSRMRVGKLTITHGIHGLSVRGGRVWLRRIAVTENGSSAWGAGIVIGDAQVRIDECSITENTAQDPGLGGGISSVGDVEISDSVISGNTSGVGGGIYNEGVMTIDRSLIERNRANYAYGGGIYTTNPLTVRDTVIRLNSANSPGGGIAYWGSGRPLVARDSKIEENSATTGGGIWVRDGTVWLPGTILRGNLPNQCTGVFPFLLWPPCP